MVSNHGLRLIPDVSQGTSLAHGCLSTICNDLQMLE